MTLGPPGSRSKARRPVLDLSVRLGVVGALEDVAVPGRHEEGLEELAVRGHILVHPPTGSSEASPHNAKLGHGAQEVVDLLGVDAVLDEDQNRAVFRMDVLADRK